ncbi:SdrD B-like domain-containing protein [Macrococcus sp. DPC7161]|uniref:YSIRK-type signal peptide-containing protein n=1 Tax=Macrococcus sp. DPC7161 TaxID=2507060 RepID=UPI00100AEC9B|nr:SdrD B-like domain-containing protein [Macrococcus sp. DPC7161]RXK17699.1 YSIRK-type signal peptide-containing protein [Macrococcus sp. DPC7161]
MKKRNDYMQQFSIRKLAASTTSVVIGASLLLSHSAFAAPTPGSTTAPIDTVNAPGNSQVSDIFGHSGIDIDSNGTIDTQTPGVVVVLTNLDTNSQYTQITDGSGYFSFPRMKAGNYEIVFSHYDAKDPTLTKSVTFSTFGYRTTHVSLILPPPVQEPVTTEPSTQEPVTTEPSTQEPVTTEPSTQEPVTTEPSTQEPVTTEPSTQEPVTTEPSTQEPVTTEPSTQEPVTAVSPTKQPGNLVVTKTNPVVNPQSKELVSPLILPNIKMEAVKTTINRISKIIVEVEKENINKSHHDVKEIDKKKHTKTKTPKEDSNTVNVVTNNHKNSPQKDKRMKQEFLNNKATSESLPSADLHGMPTFITGFGGSIL